MRDIVNIIWTILFVTAMVGGVLIMGMYPLKWMWCTNNFFEEFPFWFIITILVIAVWVMGENGGNASLTKHLWQTK